MTHQLDCEHEDGLGAETLLICPEKISERRAKKTHDESAVIAFQTEPKDSRNARTLTQCFINLPFVT